MNDDIKMPAAKLASAGLVLLGQPMTWAEVAQFMAALYTGCLFIEWAWKRVLKPLAQRRGWIGGKRREFLDSTVSGDLEK